MKEVIQSPFRDCLAHLKRVPDSMEFRGKTYHFLNHYYVCDESGEEFTDEITGNINFSQVYNQYRADNNIPFASEIVKLREICKLTKADMGRVLGFGENQYYHYELGEVPSPSNGRLLRTMIENRKALEDAIKDSPIKDCNKEKALKSLAGQSEIQAADSLIAGLIFPAKHNIYNGYTMTDANKVRQMVLFFLGRMNQGYKTALNKLMFYSDFMMYRENGVGISGLTYSALPHGNVPNNFKLLYGLFNEVDEVDADIPYFRPLCKSNTSVFNENELQILEYVADNMAHQTSSRLSEINHQEDAWLKYHHDPKLLIPFSEAFTLKSI